VGRRLHSDVGGGNNLCSLFGDYKSHWVCHGATAAKTKEKVRKREYMLRDFIARQSVFLRCEHKTVRGLDWFASAAVFVLWIVFILLILVSLFRSVVNS